MKTIVLVLKNSPSFLFPDVELIVKHIQGLWKGEELPRIICMWDKASQTYDLGSLTILPLLNENPGTWSRMELYSPRMEQYKPFLYLDLDTAVMGNVRELFDLIKDESKWITLEDFWRKDFLATPIVWFPKDCKKTQLIWQTFKSNPPALGFRMDTFLNRVTQADQYWQNITNRIVDFKPKRTTLLSVPPDNSLLICFHGKPRIYEAAKSISWVKEYINRIYNFNPFTTVIIPYNIDRGFLQEAKDSVPRDVQLLISQGNGNWPENFNKAFPQATGKYIRYLHEDDILLPDGIQNSVKALVSQDVDFVHGDAIEMTQSTGTKKVWKPGMTHPTLKDMLYKNFLHSSSMMYSRRVFETVGLFDESLNNQEEYEFHLRCLRAGLKLGYCKSPAAIYRRHPTQKVRNITKTEIENERKLVKAKYL